MPLSPGTRSPTGGAARGGHMRAPLESVIIFLFIIAAGYCGYVSMNDEDPVSAPRAGNVPVAPADTANTPAAEDLSGASPEGKAGSGNAPPTLPAPETEVASLPRADADEMQEFLTALDSRSIDRWNAFLAVHRGDAYAEAAREEVAKLIAAAKATAPAAEVLSGVSPNGKATSGNEPQAPPSS